MSIRSRQRECLFCGETLRSNRHKTGGKSDEHIIPQWLTDHLGIREMTITPTVMETTSRRIVDKREHAVSSFVAGTVCRTCNTGWMGKLEEAAKPVLIPLIADPHRLVSLKERDRATVSRWTLKTAAMLNRASAYSDTRNAMSRPVPGDHLREVMNGRLPSGVAVLGCGYPSSKPLDWLQFGTWMAPSNSIPLLKEDRNRSYKIALAFRDLVLAVVYYPSAEHCYGVIESYYHSLWVGDRGVISIPPQLDDLPAHSDSPVLEGLLRNIFLMSKTWIALVGNLATTRFVSEP